MSKSQTQGVPYLKVNGGLNAAGSPINMEATDASDILNVDLSQSGSFRWRKPIDFLGEQATGGFFLTGTSSHTPSKLFVEGAPSFSYWGVTKSTGQFAMYVVLSLDKKLYIYDFSLFNNLIEINRPFQTIDLSSYADNTMPFYRTRFFIDRNKLFVINKGCQPGYLYLVDDYTFGFAPVTITTRNITQNNPPSDSVVVVSGKKYLCISGHTSTAADKPGSGANWRVYWVQYGPTSDADSWAVSTAYTTNIQTLSVKFSAACFSAGRFWLTGYTGEPNKIYYSQTITDDFKIGRMYQFADPLNKDDSAAVDTDGGDMIINGAEKILSLCEFQNGVIVFATNGVWYVGGTSTNDVFNPTAFSVNKISDSGMLGEDGYCKVEDFVVFCGQGAIYAITKNDLYGKVKAQPISDKIEPYYTSIPAANRGYAIVRYNQTEKRLYIWLNKTTYPWVKDWNSYSQAVHARHAIIFDLQVKGWTLYSLEEDSTGNRISISDFHPTVNMTVNPDTVVDNNGNIVTDMNGSIVESLSTTEAELVNLCLLYKRSGSYVSVAFGRTASLGKKDFAAHVGEQIIDNAGNVVIDNTGNLVSADDDVASYTAYLYTAAQNFNNLVNHKQNPYVMLIFQRQESGIIDDNTGLDITAGGCLMEVAHDWATSARSTKMVSGKQVYRPHKWTSSMYDGTSTGQSIVAIKERVRGRGRSVQLRFHKDGDKSCELHGFHLGVTSSTRAT